MKKGFTLIELLIVVAIIGILAAIAVPNFLNAMVRSKVARVQSELRRLSQAYTMDHMDNNAYPPHIDLDPAQHYYVTTPIAYLSTSIYDPFQEGLDPQKEPVAAQNFHYQYHMEPVTYFLNQPNMMKNNPIFGSQLNHSSIVAWSFGPDRTFSPAYVYESSNGLSSIGEMLLAVSGGKPPDMATFRRGN